MTAEQSAALQMVETSSRRNDYYFRPCETRDWRLVKAKATPEGFCETRLYKHVRHSLLYKTVNYSAGSAWTVVTAYHIKGHPEFTNPTNGEPYWIGTRHEGFKLADVLKKLAAFVPVAA